MNFFGSPKKQSRLYTNVFVWGGCFQPQIVTQLVEATSRRERVYVLYLLVFKMLLVFIFMIKRFVLYLVFF